MIYAESASTDPFVNLALEQHVFDNLPRDERYFMLWQNAGAVIVGKHQNTAEEINAAYVKERGIRVARRLSGGGAVYHDLGNLNFSFIADAADAERLNFSLFCKPIVDVLAKMGVRAEIGGRNDMTVDGKKFSGNAQYVKQGRVLHHGTILFDSDLDVVEQALRVAPDKIASKGVKSVRSRVTNLRDRLPRDLSRDAFKDAVKRGVVGNAAPYVFSETDTKAVERLRDERYAAWEWNFGFSPKYSVCKEKRAEQCGKVQIFMEIENSCITRFASFGDYFGADDAGDLWRALLGSRLREADLMRALADVDVGYYYNNLSREALVDIILS
jgi:lipoate-protein ligase A